MRAFVFGDGGVSFVVSKYKEKNNKRRFGLHHSTNSLFGLELEIKLG